MYKRILVPIDGSPTSNLGLNEAIKLARDQSAKLRLIHLVDEYTAMSSADVMAYSNTDDLLESMRQGGRKIIDKAEALARRNGVTPEFVMIENFGGRAADFIVAQAKKWGGRSDCTWHSRTSRGQTPCYGKRCRTGGANITCSGAVGQIEDYDPRPA
jgi:nucleotide-binding universal stress UspA family protein